jgi:uncharacterized membrane protein
MSASQSDPQTSPLAKPTIKGTGNYHQQASVEALTAENVKTIRELEQAADKNRPTADRVADFITRFCGSMSFVWMHVLWFSLWIGGNAFFGSKSFDPFPFNLLTLGVSLEAIFLSTFILISENHQARVDERRSRLDLQINLLAEQENTKVLNLLKEIAEKLGINPHKDPTIAILEQSTRPENLLAQIDETRKEGSDNEDAR